MSSRPGACILWQRLDLPGHDAASVVAGRAGAELRGMAVFRDASGPTALQYRVRCMELDLGFTPATNLLPLRRLNLGVGQMAEVRSAWIEWPGADLRPLVQQYRRESVTSYRYEAQLPGGDVFSTVLRVDPFGWVVEYGGLWQAVPSSLPEEADRCHRAH